MANFSNGTPIPKLDGFALSNLLNDTATVALTGVTMQMPFRLGLNPAVDKMWTLPLEPQVSVRSRNLIAFRNINKIKGGGSIKELWAQGDYEVAVEGIFISDNEPNGSVRLEENGEYTYPDNNISRLDKLMKSGRSLNVNCRLLDLLGISLLAITEWEFPRTAGMANQYYRFSGVSDQTFELL